MALATYSDLKTMVVGLLHRTGDTVVEGLAADWITLAEADLQSECKMLDIEATASITVTDGVGTLPAGLMGIRSVYWDDVTDNALEYVSPSAYDSIRNASSTPQFYTIVGSTLKLIPYESGTAVATYQARFTALSDAAPSNAILASYPNAYLYGAMKHACVWTMDDAGLQKYGLMFNAACERIRVDIEKRKYGNDLAVRAR